ncbi:MAG TPA: hypothetical protein VKA60_17280 [Blastocatellia bacterium]|nr:hypothetical protein [Blastocatellia bacterium]
MHIIPVLGFLQSPFSDSSDSGDSWFRFAPGEASGAQYLELLVGLVLIWLLCRVLYTTMLYNRVGANKHPANFRKLIVALGLLLSVLLFHFLFLNAFGLFMLLVLGVAWFICVLVFIFTRRKVASSRS